MQACTICKSPLETRINFCATCAEELPNPLSLCAEQIISVSLRPTSAALVDRWGRAHRLDKKANIGRRPQGAGISILEASVSRRHAEVTWDENQGWSVTDLSSSNGTQIDQTAVQGTSRIESGSVLRIADVGFYFLAEAGRFIGSEAHLASCTLRPHDSVEGAKGEFDGEPTFAGLPKTALRFIEPTGGGGGFFEAFGKQLKLSLAQFELLRILGERMHRESALDELVRGFVSSSSLLAQLTWDTPSPNENHLKQLVRRLRRALDEGGFGRLIESKRGFGYRLRVCPKESPFGT